MSQCNPDWFFVAGLWITSADGEVDRAADLLVEERVAGVLGDVVIRADGALADKPRAGVHVEHADEEILTLGGGGIDDLAVAEGQLHAVAFAAVMNRGGS